MPGANSPFATGSNPFSSGAQGAETQDSGNPYQSPLGEYHAPIGLADPFAMNRVAGPATALVITASIGLVLQGISIAINLFSMVAGPVFRPQGNGIEFVFPFAANIGTGVFAMAMAGLVFVGALKMKRLESYSFSMAASIIAMIPCVSPCCLLGLPFGIWALVVLSDGRVKMAFRN
jgi:hypothetical protein